MYNTLKFLHVVSAMVWLGSGVGLLALLGSIQRSGDRATLRVTSEHVETLGARLFGPSAMLTLIFGILTVLVADGIGFTDTWIVIGLVAVAVSFVMTGIAGATTKRMKAVMAEHGPDHEGVAALGARTSMIHMLQVVVLVVAVWAMVFKPEAGV